MYREYYGSKRGRSPLWKGCTVASDRHSGQGRKLRADIFKGNHKAEGMNWKWCEAFTHQAYLNVTYFLQQGYGKSTPSSSKTVPPNETKCSNAETVGGVSHLNHHNE